MNTLTTTEAAVLLGITPDSVRHLIKRGVLAATRRGRDWFIEAAEVERYQRERRKPGRPMDRRE